MRLHFFFRQRLRRVLLAVMALTLAVVLANCGGASEDPSTADGDGIEAPTGALVFGSVGQPVNLTPGDITDGNSIYVQQQIYNYLIGNEPGSTELAPELATEWSASEDGRTWTFNLREGVKFHDGTDFNAEAVVFNVNRWWDPEFEFGYRDAGALYEIWTDLFGGFKGDEASTLVDVRAVDELTVEFEIAEPFAAFPAAISSGYFGIASPTAVQAGTDYGTPSGAAVGTGPFVFDSWISGDRVTLTKFEDYWEDGMPKVDQLVFSFVEDPAARLAQLRAGTLDFTVDLTPDQLTEIESDPNLEAVYRPSFNVGYLALNPSYEPLATKEVRQAIAQAINKPAIVDAFWGELGETDGHFVPPSLEDYRDSSIDDYEYSIEAAQEAIAEAGYPDGFDLDMWYMPVSRPYFPNPKPIAEAFAAELSQIGINVNLQTKDWGAYLADRNVAPGFQSFMLGWTGDYGDPDNFLYAHFGPGATQDLGDYQNPELFDLLEQARINSDPAEREALYQQADALIFEEALRIPIVHSQPLLAKRAEVDGWEPSPFSSEPFVAVEKG
ncbi:Bacterial extracellular solute-binding protein, family 5 [Synechococcus sp. PCC 7335]|uniref:ABC transporter substrate-binding protein n=1 Tax=Synechococcus sp. (strain ATCC 29403 / PCC 7335) TaxID=91464 RepID=UPI00017EE08A|nr:ABC transporter substrate-binding protein [Synechococcus sp. PCC 7335]EDX85700.1 Bacterial extracellular solute-binding protein, family 5 [Synechococcus sp. PCC 7335]